MESNQSLDLIITVFALLILIAGLFMLFNGMSAFEDKQK